MVAIFIVLFILNFLNTSVVCVGNNYLSTNLLHSKIESPFSNNNHSDVFKTRNKGISLLLNSTRKWQINMLWKKNRVFIEATADVNRCSPRDKKADKEQNQLIVLVENPEQKLSQIPKPQISLQSSTQSYIEFYYFNEIDFNQNISMSEKVNKNYTKLEHTKSLKSHFPIREKTISFLNPLTERERKKAATNIGHQVLRTETNKAIFFETTKKEKRDNPIRNSHIANAENTIKIKNTGKSNATYSMTSPYDRVKFFDIYDSDTYSPYVITTTKKFNSLENSKHINLESNTNSQLPSKRVGRNYVTLSHVNRTRFAKKDVNNLKYEESLDHSNRSDHLTKTHRRIIIDTSEIKLTPQYTNTKEYNNISQTVSWSDYPFVAAYVYEPLQVRCDAAAISPHWLIAAAECLYRHHKKPKSVERSAFVIYCSDNWRHPVRISYVRRSILHPLFHPKDTSRRHLYNIGAIQVVNSMLSTCSGWSSVSLMSHQFAAVYNGTTAISIGWALDRYLATSYSRRGVSQGPLMMYKNFIYLNRCPGNADYSKVKYINTEISKNIYCISMPTYSIENTDPIHGALLLLGGKLIGIYLQEERRFYGEQSSEYTGIWRLLPWIFEVAREPDNQEFLLEI